MAFLWQLWGLVDNYRMYMLVTGYTWLLWDSFCEGVTVA